MPGPPWRWLPSLLSSPPSTAPATARAPSGPGETGRHAGGVAADAPESLDVCLLSYRSDPHSGGQGVYVKQLSRALTARGHDVDVLSGRPYPDLDDDVGLVRLPGENVVDDLDRLGQFEAGYLGDPDALFEWLSALSGGFPDPFLFGRRVRRHFEERDPDYDVVHDNQSLCYALPWLGERGYPVVATVHHPITADREVDLAAADGVRERLLVRRWYRFLRMQRRVAGRLDHVVTVSSWARDRTVADFEADPGAVEVVHNGVDTDLFEPRERAGPDRYRLMTTVSADAPIKGLVHLLRALARVRETLDVELLVVGEFTEDGRAATLIDRLDLSGAVTTRPGISTDRMVDCYATADLAVVPSLYEGFGLPAVEAMACEVPVVATDGGGLPEVVGEAGVVVPAGDDRALAGAVEGLLTDPRRRARLGRRGRRRVRSRFTWERAARRTAAVYRRAYADR